MVAARGGEEHAAREPALPSADARAACRRAHGHGAVAAEPGRVPAAAGEGEGAGDAVAAFGGMTSARIGAGAPSEDRARVAPNISRAAAGSGGAPRSWPRPRSGTGSRRCWRRAGRSPRSPARSSPGRARRRHRRAAAGMRKKSASFNAATSAAGEPPVALDLVGGAGDERREPAHARKIVGAWRSDRGFRAAGSSRQSYPRNRASRQGRGHRDAGCGGAGPSPPARRDRRRRPGPGGRRATIRWTQRQPILAQDQHRRHEEEEAHRIGAVDGAAFEQSHEGVARHQRDPRWRVCGT